MTNAAFIAMWVVCGVGAAGILFAYFQGDRPAKYAAESKREDLGAAVFFALLGPITLVIGFLISGFAKHGWRLR